MNTKPNPQLKALYGLTAVTALFTGFGNMPLWGRYYVSDVPGLGWSSNFFINVNVHILAGSLLLAIGVFAVTTSVVMKKIRSDRLTRSGKIRGFLLAVALATGILMVVKNLPGNNFPMTLLMISNFAHMGSAMLFIIASIVALIFKHPWRQQI